MDLLIITSGGLIPPSIDCFHHSGCPPWSAGECCRTFRHLRGPIIQFWCREERPQEGQAGSRCEHNSWIFTTQQPANPARKRRWAWNNGDGWSSGLLALYTLHVSQHGFVACLRDVRAAKSGMMQAGKEAKRPHCYYKCTRDAMSPWPLKPGTASTNT